MDVNYLTTKEIFEMEEETGVDVLKLGKSGEESKCIKWIIAHKVDPKGEMSFGNALKEASAILEHTFNGDDVKN